MAGFSTLREAFDFAWLISRGAGLPTPMYVYGDTVRPIVLAGDELSNDITVAVYHWGQFSATDMITPGDLKFMTKLGGDALLGFEIRKKDEGKVFVADESDIDEGPDGISVKYALAVGKKDYERAWR